MIFDSTYFLSRPMIQLSQADLLLCLSFSWNKSVKGQNFMKRGQNKESN